MNIGDRVLHRDLGTGTVIEMSACDCPDRQDDWQLVRVKFDEPIPGWPSTLDNAMSVHSFTLTVAVAA